MNKFDPMTGKPIAPEANTGTPSYRPANEEDLLQVSPTPGKKIAPKQKMPKGLLIGMIAGGVLALAAIVWFLIVPLFTSPVRKLVNGGEKTISGLQSTDLGSTLKQVTTGGGITLTVNTGKNEELSSLISRLAVGKEYEVDAKAELGLFFTKGAAALSLDTELNGSDLLDALVTLSKEELALSSTALFSKTNYGVNLKNMAKNLTGSIFDPDEGTQYALPQETFDALTGEGGFGLSDAEKMLKDAKTVLKKTFDALVTSVSKNGKISKGSDTITIGDKDVKTSTVVIELDAKAIKAIASDMLSFLNKDKDVKTLIKDIQGAADSGLFGNIFDEDEDVEDEFYTWIEDTKDELDNLEENLEDVTFTLTGYLKGSYLVQLQLDEKVEKEKSTIRVTVGPDPKSPQEITLYSKDFRGNKDTVTYKVSENSKNSYEASFSVKVNDETPLKAKISWDKKEGGLKVSGTLTRSDYYGTQTTDFEARATLTKSGKKTVLELGKVTVDERELNLKGISLTLDGGAKFPSISKYTDILTLEEDELEDLLKDLQQTMQEIFQDAAEDLK